MSPPEDQPARNRVQVVFNLTLAAVAGQVGCVTLLIILAALFGGLWLDNHLNSRPLFTVILMIGSVPVTLVAMFWVVRTATSRLTSTSERKDETQEENLDDGR